MRKRDLRFLSVILTLMISGALFSCAPKLVTPDFEFKRYSEIKQDEPDCSGEIRVLEISADNPDELVLDALFCYRTVWKHWENAYRIFDAQIGAIDER